jgi:hypothetical protein
MRKVTRILSLVACLAALTATARGQTDPTAAPKLVIPQVEHDLGEVKAGEVVKHTFTFKNEGKGELEIKSIIPACGCETVDYDRKIAPGQAGKITLQVRTAGFSGAVSKTAAVQTNDPNLASFTIALRMLINESAPQGEKRGPFVISPVGQVDLTAPQGVSHRVLLTIYDLGPQPTRITKAVAGGDAFAIALEPQPDGRRYVVKIASAETLPLGSHRQVVKLLTESAQMPEIDLPLRVSVVPPVGITPQKLVFDAVPLANADGGPPTRSKFLWLRQQGGPELVIERIESSLPFLKAVVDSGEPGRLYILRVSFVASPPKGTHSGQLTIVTNRTDVPKLEVEVTVKTQ